MGGKGSGSKGGPGTGRPRGCSRPCGTKTKYNYHRRNGEDCAVCKQGERDRARIKQGYIGAVKQTSKQRKMLQNTFCDEMKFKRVGCVDCGLQVNIENLCVFDWNHRNPQDKLFTIGSDKHNMSIATLGVEIAKCDLLCANCHRMETQRQRREGVLTGYKVKHCSLLTLFDCPSPM